MTKKEEKKPLVIKNDKVTILSTFTDIFKMLRSSFSKEYPNFPMYTFLGIVMMGAYLIFPADLIPDFIPFVGIVDDATMLAFFVFLAQNDVEKFRAWQMTVSETKNTEEKINTVEIVEKGNKEEEKKGDIQEKN